MSEAMLPAAPLWVATASRVIRWLPAGRYRAMNWVARRRVRPFWAALPAASGGLQFHCDLRDHLMREVCFTGCYEPQESLLLRHILQPGMTFVDVGANWGYFTLLGSHLVGPNGRVVSIEADPRASRILGANVRRNGLTSVTVVAAAASDGHHTVFVRRYGSDNDESSNFGVELADAPSDGRSAEGLRGFEVPAKPLDAILDAEDVYRIDVLKMDIEGAEGRALKGLSRRLAAGSIDRIIVELHPAHLRKQNLEPHALIQELGAFGYEAWSIDHSPSVHRRAAVSRLDVRSMLSRTAASSQLGEWPHLLFARHGLAPVGGPGRPTETARESGSSERGHHMSGTPVIR